MKTQTNPINEVGKFVSMMNNQIKNYKHSSKIYDDAQTSDEDAAKEEARMINNVDALYDLYRNMGTALSNLMAAYGMIGQNDLIEAEIHPHARLIK